MLGLDRLVGPRATPRARSVVMERRRGRVNVRYTAGAPADYIFTADIYAFADAAIQIAISDGGVSSCRQIGARRRS